MLRWKTSLVVWKIWCGDLDEEQVCLQLLSSLRPMIGSTLLDTIIVLSTPKFTAATETEIGATVWFEFKYKIVLHRIQIKFWIDTFNSHYLFIKTIGLHSTFFLLNGCPLPFSLLLIHGFCSESEDVKGNMVERRKYLKVKTFKTQWHKRTNQIHSWEPTYLIQNFVKH